MRKDRWISTVAQMKALVSPVRYQMHLAMEMLGPCSVRELATRMGREPTALYYHIEILNQAGILTRYGMRRAGPREEATYELATKRVHVDMNQRSPRFIEAVASGCGSLLRYTERTFLAALRNDATIKTGKASELRISQVSVRLTKESLIELNARLDELQAFINEADSFDAETVCAITVCVAPVASGD